MVSCKVEASTQLLLLTNEDAIPQRLVVLFCSGMAVVHPIDLPWWGVLAIYQGTAAVHGMQGKEPQPPPTDFIVNIVFGKHYF